MKDHPGRRKERFLWFTGEENRFSESRKEVGEGEKVASALSSRGEEGGECVYIP